MDTLEPPSPFGRARIDNLNTVQTADGYTMRLTAGRLLVLDVLRDTHASLRLDSFFIDSSRNSDVVLLTTRRRRALHCGN